MIVIYWLRFVFVFLLSVAVCGGMVLGIAYIANLDIKSAFAVTIGGILLLGHINGLVGGVK
jgi:hypothetical protein